MVNTLLLWLYKATLRLFPQLFRREFGAEMVEIFQSLMQESREKGAGSLLTIALRELVQLPAAAWRAHQSQTPLLRTLTQSPFHPLPADNDGRFSLRQRLLETTPFLLAAAVTFTFTYGWPEAATSWAGTGWLALSATVAVSLGLWRGLPRWTYPWAGILLGACLLWAQAVRLVAFWGVMVLALAALLLTAAYTHHFIQPLPPFWRQAGVSMARDWTRLCFGLYGLLPALILLAFDDSYANDLTPYLALALLLAAGGAWVYGRCRRQQTQFTALIAASGVALLPALLEQVQFYGSWSAAIQTVLPLWALLLLMVLLPLASSVVHRAWTADPISYTGS